MANNKGVASFLSEQKTLIAIIVIGVVLSLTSPYFFSYYNLVNILSSMAIEGVVVIGMAYLIILGELDLSVGSNMAFSCILAIFFQRYGIVAGVIAGIVGGTFVGLVNGFLVTRLRISSIAVTLGMMIMVNGIVFALTGSRSVKGSNSNFMRIAQPLFAHVDGSIIVFLVAVIVFQIVLTRTFFGRSVYAIGGNPVASRFFGIAVDRVRTICFGLTGMLSGIAGVLLAAKINVASGNLGGSTALLAITGVLLGGVSLAGGEGSVFKAFMGFLLIAILRNAMVLLRLESFIQDIISGAILILILIFEATNSERMKYA